MTKPALMVDARCLQTPDYARRGIGLHLASMLRADQARHFAITLMFDPDLPVPDRDLAALGDAATMTAYTASRTQGVFLQPAPFSFPPRPIGRILLGSSVRRVAVVHDFVPYDWPQTYLSTGAARRAYAAQRAALRRYEWYLANSRVTEARLHAMVAGSIGRSDVTGVAVRPSLLGLGHLRGFEERVGVLVVSGDDPRKNPEIVVQAGLGVPIRYVGIHAPAMRATLAALHDASGGAADDLMFLPRVSDAELAEAYRAARLVIAPSRAEGFSMPVAEAMAFGTPVLAADEPAQAELVDGGELFPPDDHDALHRKAAALLTDPARWHAVQAAQHRQMADFAESAVAARFWAPIAALASPAPAPFVRRPAKPRIAFLTPLPPAASGCADHSAGVLAALGTIAEVTAFSDTPDPLVPDGVRFGGRADGTVMRSPRFDAIVAVLGNSQFHRTEMHLLLEYGAAAILHDARMSGFYRGTLGMAHALGVASAELGSDVTQQELDAWEREQVHMPTRFIGEIAAASCPMIVHAAETARWLATTYGADAVFLPFAPYRLADPASLTEAGRAAARERLGMAAGVTLVASFGHVHPGKEPERLIATFAVLARTRPCRFALLGSGNPTLVAALHAQAAKAGIAPDALVLDAAQVPEPVYRDYLAAADIAIQLRCAPPGSISGALADVIAAGLPCVAAATLVEALQPPSFIVPVADDAAPDVIAAAAARLLDAGRAMIPPLRDGFLHERSMARYAAGLLEAMLG